LRILNFNCLFVVQFLVIFLRINSEKIETSNDNTIMMNHEIILKNNGESEKLNSHFENSTNGQKADFETEVSINSDDRYLHISFACHQDYYVNENNMLEHNAPLYNQEVFEIFISPSHADSKHYLEVEINPNNALWIGTINNPTLGAETQTLERMIAHSDAGILHEAYKSNNSWNGKMSIPWALIGKDKEGKYRINFYRIRSNKSHTDANWICDTETCDFVCWNATLSGQSPAFHRPKRFGYLTVK
jgi:hypothetical protein